MDRSCVLVMDLAIRLPYAQSLKEKRNIRLRIMDSLRVRFKVSIAETDLQDEIKEIRLRLAYVALSESRGRQSENKILEWIQGILDGVAGELSWQSDYL